MSSISFVIPCLDEAHTLGGVLGKISTLQENALSDCDCEVLVVDNGSTDSSVDIAKSLGAKVVSCSEKGYGAALTAGILAAQSEIIVFADGDGTYDLLEAPTLINELVDGNHDLVIGSRIRGRIQPGAMPLLHRYLGTPVLTALVNLLHCSDRVYVSDCNSGFRCLRREAFNKWNIKSRGMEFASEMLIGAVRSGASYGEVPISFFSDPNERVPHLQTWRDGTRHLLVILLESPSTFRWWGLSLFFVSWLALIFGLISGPIRVGPVLIFGIHTMLFALLGTIFALSLWSIGLYLAAIRSGDNSPYRNIVELEEGKLFWGIVALMFALMIILALILYRWALSDFAFLALEKEVIILVAMASNGALFALSVLTAHLIKRA